MGSAGFLLGSVCRGHRGRLYHSRRRRTPCLLSAHQNQSSLYFPQKELVLVLNIFFFFNPRAPSDTMTSSREGALLTCLDLTSLRMPVPNISVLVTPSLLFVSLVRRVVAASCSHYLWSIQHLFNHFLILNSPLKITGWTSVFLIGPDRCMDGFTVCSFPVLPHLNVDPQLGPSKAKCPCAEKVNHKQKWGLSRWKMYFSQVLA